MTIGYVLSHSESKSRMSEIRELSYLCQISSLGTGLYHLMSNLGTEGSLKALKVSTRQRLERRRILQASLLWVVVIICDIGPRMFVCYQLYSESLYIANVESAL